MLHPLRVCALPVLLILASTMASCAFLPDAPPADVYFGQCLPRIAQHPATQPGRSSADPAELSATQPAETGLPISARVPTTGPVAVTVEESILLALGNNRALCVERLNPCIRRTFEQEERAVFDPTVFAEISHARERGMTEGSVESSTETNIIAGVEQFLPTGTTLTADLNSRYLTSSLRDDRRITRVGLSVNQALLRGAGLDVNLATVRQARLDTLASEYELRAVAEAIVAETEQTYWDYVLAQKTMQIVIDSRDLAIKQRQETKERIDVGALAPTELAAAEAELARRNENLINAESAMATTRLRLLRLMNPQTSDFWTRQVVSLSPPTVPKAPADSGQVHAAIAMRLRPDLNQARLLIERNELEVVKTRNGLLPRLDLFATIGKSGYSESFGHDLAGLFDNDRFDVLVGARFEYPPANRAARARNQRACLNVEQSERALANLAQLAQVDVRTAIIEVERTRAQIDATAATSRFQRETLRAETEKFGVGRSTSFLVAQAQRDLLVAQIAEVASVVNHLKSLVELYRQEGSLLQRYGIIAAGARPVLSADCR